MQLKSDSRSEFQRPQNVGFGLTQLFPVLVALLVAEPGQLVIIENPEVHLHPRAQQQIGFFAAEAAAAGVQVMVETHSDHVLNGIRLAVRRGKLASDDVAIHFLGVPGTDTNSLVSPTIDSDGRLDQWPAGFFDQFDLALSELL